LPNSRYLGKSVLPQWRILSETRPQGDDRD
jgi:hypothetical protein